MKKRSLVLFVILSLVFILSYSVIAQTSLRNFNSNTYLISGAEDFVIDISNLKVEKLNIVKNSLSELKQFGDIKDYFEDEKRILIKFEKDNIEQLNINDLGISLLERYPGYIIEFKSSSVLEKKASLEEEIGDIKNRIKSLSLDSGSKIEGLGSYKSNFGLENLINELDEKEKNVNVKVLKYKKDLENEHSKAIKDINDKLQKDLATLNPFNKFLEFFKRILGISSSITGSVILEDDNVREFSNTFNGFAFSGKLSTLDIQKIRSSSYVKKVSPDRKVRASLMDSVPLIQNGIGAGNVDRNGEDCQVSGEDCLNGEGITIAIIDTGVDYTHPSLGGCFGEGCKVIGGYDFVNNDEDPRDDYGHGTHVAATAAGKRVLNGVVDNSLFSYEGDGDDSVEIDVEIKDGSVRFNPLFGSQGGFTGIGESSTKKLRTAVASELIFSDKIGGSDSDEYFIASYTPGYESYLLRARTYEASSPKRNETNIQRRTAFGWETVCPSRYPNTTSNPIPTAKFCDIGDVTLTINSVSHTSIDKSVNLTGGSGVVFDRVFDANRNYMFLPREADLPAEEIIRGVFNEDDYLIETVRFYFDSDDKTVVDVTKNVFDQRAAIYRGVAPDATLYAYKVLNEHGSGSFSNVIASIERAVDPNQDGDFSDHLDIISLSLGGGGNPDDPLSQSIDNAVNLGVVAVISAGNSGYPESIGSPGTARNAITVGAIDKNNNIAGFSSRGPVLWDGNYIIKPDIVAPGVLICAAQYDEWYEGDRECDPELERHIAISGTSMAAPHVAGMAALIMQANPNLNAKDIKSVIKTSAEDLGNNYEVEVHTQGNGKVNVINSLKEKITIDRELGFGMLGSETSSQKIVSIKNIDDNSVSLTITILSAENEDGDAMDVVSSSVTTLDLDPGESSEVTFDLTFPLTHDGYFTGKVLYNDGEKDYLTYYTFSRYSKLELTFDDHYPNYYWHNSEINRFYGSSQGWDFLGGSGSFFVRSGNYILYTISDFVDLERPNWYPETDMYYLYETIDIPIGSVIQKSFSLDNIRKFIFKAESFSGEQLNLYEWQRTITTYKGKTYGCDQYNGYPSQVTKDECINNPQDLFCDANININGYLYCNDRVFMSSHTSHGFGDREIYIQNKPDNGLNTDIGIKYWGSPKNE